MKHFYVILLTLFTAFCMNAQIVNIPDVNFKAALLENYPVIDTNGDGEIQYSEATGLTYLSLENENISNLTGIEAFVGLTYLSVSGNSLTSLDLSSNTQLYELNCYNNQLTNLNISSCSNLYRLNCNNNQLTGLDLNNNINLYEASIYHNNIFSLDLSNNANLDELIAFNNEISSINLNGATALNSLSLTSNQLSTLDLSTNFNLEDLSCGHNQLTSIILTDGATLRNVTINNNLLTTLDLSNVVGLQQIDCSFNQLSELDISSNPVLQTVDVDSNLFTSIDDLISNTTSVLTLYAKDNQITSLDLSNNISITRLYLNNNQLTDLIGNNTIEQIDCTNNQFTTIDLSENFENLDYIKLNDNANLNYINFKNGRNNYYSYIFQISSFDNLLNLQAVCVDDVNSNFASWIQAQNSQPIVFTEYCSFTPGSDYYSVQGVTTIDLNANGCGASDGFYPNLNLQITDGTDAGSFYSNASGIYSMPIQAGNYIITPQLENTTYYTVSPSTLAVNFPSSASPFVQDFCITPTGNHDDLEVTIIPLEDARPGFDTDFKLIYKNKGTTTLSGSVDITFDDDYMEVLTTTPTAGSQTTGNLSWNYTDILPFETRGILFTMTLNTPTDPSFPLNGDDVLTFTATANPLATDETPEDNVFVLDQTVVNSYDPNDKTCLEGDFITEAHVGNYVHYLIRFENTGTASAVNVVVKDVIDISKYDLSSLIPLDSSHEMFTRIRNGNEIEFIFENIQLPFDDATNDGYVLFKIKTLPTLQIGDSFSNTAEIYFDYNAPIITNDAVTNVEANLGVDELAFSTGFNLFPNPAGTYFQIATSNGVDVLSVEILDVTGKRLKWFNASQRYNIEGLNTGMYFVTVRSTDGKVTKKMMKR